MSDVDPDEARRLLLEELSRGEYARQGSIIERILRLLSEWVSSLLDGTGGGSTTGALLVAVLAAIAIVLAVLVLRRTGLVRRRAVLREETHLRADPAVGADELRRRAAAARDAGRTDDAVVLALRAVVRDLSARTLLDVTDGMTAHEAAVGAARAFPALRGRLLRTADAFDTAAYSRRSAAPKQAEDAVRLAEYLAQASPDASALETL